MDCDDIITNAQGHDVLTVYSATVSLLSRFLNPDIPYVWILGHWPNESLRFYEAEVPLNQRSPIKARVRALSYDLEIPTLTFLQRAADLDGHGLVLIQSTKPMPDTFDLSRIPDAQQDSVLRQNGAFLRLYLPHSHETSQIICYEAGWLAKVRSKIGMDI